MPLPANVSTCSVVGRWLTADGEPATGRVELRAIPGYLLDSTAVPPTTIVSPPPVKLDAAGAIATVVPATDDNSLSVTGWVWVARVHLTGEPVRIIPFEAPSDGSVDLTAVAPVPVSMGVPTAKGDKGDKGDPGDLVTDRGDEFMAKLDTKAPTATIAVLSDSTGYKNSGGNYVGTDGREWPKQLAKWIGDTYAMTLVNYHLLSLASPITYAATEVVEDGVTGGEVTTVLADTFPGGSGALAGSAPETGSAWSGAGFNRDGSGNATQAANTATTGGCTAAGRLKTTWVYELVPTASGNVVLLGAFISTSTFLSMTDNSNDVVNCNVVTPAGGGVVVHSFTYAEAGVSASVAGDVTASIEHKADGTVVFTFGAATYTHALSGGEDATFATAARAGMSGTRVGYKMRSILTTSIVPTTPPAATVDVYNGSFSSKDAQWSESGYASLVPVTPDAVIISHSHNHEAESPATFETVLDSLVFAIHTVHPDAAIIIASQNPEGPAATTRAAHAARMADLRRYARTRGFGYVPVYEAWLAQVNPTSLLNVDGVHPLGSGIDVTGDAVIAYLSGLSMRP